MVLYRKKFNYHNLKNATYRNPSVGYRGIVNAIIWIIINGKSWRNLPSKFTSYPTCNRYFNDWKKMVFLKKILTDISQYLDPKSSLYLIKYIKESL